MYIYIIFVHRMYLRWCRQMPSSTYVYRTTTEYFVPAETASGRYYWTLSLYWESDYNNPTSDPSSNIITVATQAAVSEGVSINRRRYERVYGPGTLLYDVYPGPNGSRPGLDRVMLHNAVFVSAGKKNERWWWKRLRCVLSPAEAAGGVLPSSTIAWVQDNFVTPLSGVPLLNNRLEPVGPMTISPKVHPWQWRHGTKRRSRNVLGAFID